MNIKESIERVFTRWGDFVYRARWPVITTMLAMALASGSQLPKLYTDTSTENYFNRDEERAVRETLDTTGRALLFASLVLVSGFLIYSLSSMSNLVDFGILTGFAIASAFLADVTLAPALLVLIARTRRDASHGKAKAGRERADP